MLVRRRDDLLTTPRPEFLATREEQAVLARIEYIEGQLEYASTPFEGALVQRMPDAVRPVRAFAPGSHAQF
jgi:hypothetical protein